MTWQFTAITGENMPFKFNEFLSKHQSYLALTSLVADIIAIVTVWFSVNAEGQIGPSAGVLILALVNTAIVIVAYLAIRDSQKYFDQYKNIDSTIFSKDKEISDLKNKMDDMFDDRIKVARIVHNIGHEYRQEMLRTSSNGQLSKEQFEEVKSSFKQFMLFCMTNIKELFDIMTKDDCSVCIKVVINDSEVKTFIRDPVSYRIRKDADARLPVFPIHGNSAFDMLTGVNPKNYYLSNSLNQEDEYTNLNKNWKKSYNASLVVPIRISYKEENGAEYRVIGFLCVDNMKGGFDHDICLNYLATIGDLFFNIFESYGKLEVAPSA
ncbi:hypothetical protein KOM00_04105 [Geomonas sp. Red69]|uniref:hypothetical protein n=1 Tax=Geomonas diazotrophica TaxID=2843197 RepID=UPI001C10D320|nr:hypothetical protein [Geomonas diazotrophica]MBU5635909.1 hypothetical protein [Geomonas diazotrophica]